MSEEQRRFAAIMFSDIVGFTAMTQKNESISLQLLQAHNELLRPAFARHLGQEVKTIGDSFLVEFNSPLDAFLCAIDIQEMLYRYNQNIPSKDLQIQIRIGLHYGDIVHQDNDVFGDAVNICSRIQPLAAPGGICLSEQVFSEVNGRSPFQFQKLPTPALKNVIRPVVVYQVLLPWLGPTETADNSKTKGKASNGQSISIKQRVAVLPIESISENPNEEFFGDGLTEELIAVLSNIKDIRVIARSSVLRYKGQQAFRDITQIGMELNVGSILDGSIRKSGNKIRVSVHVIDVETTELIWTKIYDYELNDLFFVQSDIAKQVSKALKVKLRFSEKARIEKKETESVDAYTLYLNGRFLLHKRTKQAMIEAVKYFEDAVSKDSRFARAYAGLADSYLLLGSYGYMEAKEAYSKAKQYISKALDLDQYDAEAHDSLGFLLEAYYYDFAAARSEFEIAIDLNPSSSQARHWHGMNLAISMNLEGAIEELEKAMEIDPLSPQVGTVLGGFYAYVGRDDDALKTWAEVLKFNPDNVPIYLNMALFYAKKKDKELAISNMKKTLKLAWEPLEFKCVFGYIYAVLGEREEALKILETVVERAKKEYVSPFYLAILYSGLGDHDRCLEYIEKSIDDKSCEIESLINDSMFERIRSDPRLVEILSKIGVSLHSPLEGSSGREDQNILSERIIQVKKPDA
jgi:adenylate cyclase